MKESKKDAKHNVLIPICGTNISGRLRNFHKRLLFLHDRWSSIYKKGDRDCDMPTASLSCDRCCNIEREGRFFWLQTRINITWPNDPVAITTSIVICFWTSKNNILVVFYLFYNLHHGYHQYWKSLLQIIKFFVIYNESIYLII